MDEWDRERWRGEIDADLKTIKETLRDVKSVDKTLEKDLSELKVIVTGLTTKITAYASLGAFLGGGLMSFIVGLFLRR